MGFNFNVEQIKEIMESFYNLSGIRFALFDSLFREIISFPKRDCDFCKAMKSCPQTRRKCKYADRRSFLKCEKENSLIIYKCHAGLVEAVMPLHDNEKIIGYLMFGQITDNPDKSELFYKAQDLSDKYGIDKTELKKAIEIISFKSPDEISAAAKIMEACTSYIIYKELITPENSKTLDIAKKYIDEHICCDIDLSDLCKTLGIGRTKLYEIFSSETKTGIAKYIRTRRLHLAKKLLKTTDLPISEIAFKVGFSDYNYFSRIFKKHYGKSPKSYRK